MSNAQEVMNEIERSDIEGIITSVVAEYVWPRHARHGDPSDIAVEYLRSFTHEERYYVMLGMLGVAFQMLGNVTKALLYKSGTKRLTKGDKETLRQFLVTLEERGKMNQQAGSDS